MTKQIGKTALITGATSGIGRELANEFAKNGFNLIIVARSEQELGQTQKELTSEYNIRVTILPKDLFDPNAAEELYNQVKLMGFTIDVLANDAGQGEYGFFWETDLRRELNIINLNIVATVILTKLFLKEMIERNDGKILQLASMVSKSPSPLMAVYSGTKAFIYNFTQALINEVKDTKVTITALLPGATDTDFFNKANAEESKTYQDGDLADPAGVAKDGYEALMSGESKIISGVKNKLQAAIGNLMPDEVVTANTRKQMEKKDKKEK